MMESRRGRSEVTGGAFEKCLMRPERRFRETTRLASRDFTVNIDAAEPILHRARVLSKFMTTAYINLRAAESAINKAINQHLP